MKSRVDKFAVTADASVSTKELADNSVLLSAAPPQLAFRPVVSLRMDEIDKNHAQQMASLKSEQMKTIALGVAGWALPLIAVYLLGSLISRTWKRKRIRRL